MGIHEFLGICLEAIETESEEEKKSREKGESNNRRETVLKAIKEKRAGEMEERSDRCFGWHDKLI